MATGLPELEDFITREHEALGKYATQNNANPWYIERQNVKMDELVRINNGIARLQYHEYWEAIEAEMQRLEEINPAVKGHMVLFNADLRVGNYTQIQVKTNPDAAN